MIETAAEFIPRPHQERTMQRVRQAASEGHKRILVVAPCAAGKMGMAAMLMKAATDKGQPAIFLADRRELIHQHEFELIRQGVNFGTMMAGIDPKSTCAMAQVIGKDTLLSRAFRRQRITPPQAAVVLPDEAHLVMARGWQTILEYYPNAFVVGFTATPCRSDGRGLGKFFTKLIIGATYAELQDAGYLVRCRVFAPQKPDLSGIKLAKGDYDEKALAQRVNTATLVGNIIADWKSRAADRITICFAAGVQHSIYLRNEFRRAGIVAEHLDGETPTTERDDLIGRLGDGKIQVLCNCGVLQLGVDVPIVKCIILARPTKSLVLYRQTTGRAMRPYPGYDDCIILDHAGAIDLHEQFPDDDVEWSLSDKEKARPAKDRDGKPRGRVHTCGKCKTAFRGNWCPNCGAPASQCDPYICKKCGEKYRGPQCPACGYRPERAPRKVRMQKGELEERQREALRSATPADKQRHWDQCVGIAIHKNGKVGMAAHMYREKYGVWPANDLCRVPRGKIQWNMLALDWYRECLSGAPVTG